MVQQRLKTVQSWVVMARELVDNPVDNIQSIEWVRESEVRIETEVIGSRLWGERSGLVNQAEIMHWITNNHSSNRWFVEKGGT